MPPPLHPCASCSSFVDAGDECFGICSKGVYDRKEIWFLPKLTDGRSYVWKDMETCDKYDKKEEKTMQVKIEGEIEGWINEMLAKGTFASTDDAVEFGMRSFKAFCEWGGLDQKKLNKKLKDGGFPDLDIIFPIRWNPYWAREMDIKDMTLSSLERVLKMESVEGSLFSRPSIVKEEVGELLLKTGTAAITKKE